MSKDQQVQAVRVANVPEDEFEEAVESGATVTKLAGMGRARPQHGAGCGTGTTVRKKQAKLFPEPDAGGPKTAPRCSSFILHYPSGSLEKN